MKPRRPPAPALSGQNDQERAPSDPRRRRRLRLVMACLPILLVGLVEVGLRLGGCGYPVSFFLRARQQERAVLVENPKFGWRFFPPAVARSPLPLALPAEKPSGALRIFVFGESAAMGDPEPAYGFARQLDRLLQVRHPGRRVEVVNVAMTAINTHVIREIARDCASRAGDCWIIYAGNNEVIGPFGAGTVFGRQAPGLAFVRANLALKRTRLGQFLARCFERRTAGQWEGMEMFLQQQVRREDPRLGVVYRHFAANLSAIIECGQKSGAKVLLATMAVNLADCPPFASQHRAGFTAAQVPNSPESRPAPGTNAATLAEWERCYALGRQAEGQGRFAEALSAYQQAAALDAEYAELVFHRARCERAQGLASAQADFGLARDLDGLRFRVDSRLNDIIRQTAAARGLRLLDAERELGRRSAAGAPGQDLFYDHVHLNFKGNYALAALFVPAVEAELFGSRVPAAGAPEAVAEPVLPTEAEVARRLAFTDFDRRRVLEEMRLRLEQAPFCWQSNARERAEGLGKELAAAAPPLGDLLPEYRAALALAPDDAVLHANFARVLEAAGDAGAAAEWREVARLLPREPDAWFQLGNLEHSAGHYGEAVALFEEALKRKPDCAEALNGLGLVLVSQDKLGEASGRFHRALEKDPRSTAARVNLAVVLARQGNVLGAAAQYRSVLGSDTNNVGARVNLAKLLATQGQTNEAIGLYTEALQLQPDNPIAQYDLANTLAAQGRHAEAAPHYAAAVQARPDFVEARYNLALEFARQGRINEALAQFAEVARLKPDSAEAHYNYGIALAKVQRFAEAAREFRATLKQQPDNTEARSALDRALQLEKAPRSALPPP